jgi:hypothetical protein
MLIHAQKIQVKRMHAEENRRRDGERQPRSAGLSRFDSPALGSGWFLGRRIFRFGRLAEEKRQEFRREWRIEIIRNYNQAAMHPQRANSV